MKQLDIGGSGVLGWVLEPLVRGSLDLLLFSGQRKVEFLKSCDPFPYRDRLPRLSLVF